MLVARAYQEVKCRDETNQPFLRDLRQSSPPLYKLTWDHTGRVVTKRVLAGFGCDGEGVFCTRQCGYDYGRKVAIEQRPAAPTDGPVAVGSQIYVPTSLYLSHGADDFQGGLCKVSEVKAGISAGEEATFVSVEERPGHSYNWAYLEPKQAELRERFGTDRGYPDPDNAPEANRWD